MTDVVKLDNEYKEWIREISSDFKKSQIRAAVKVNEEMLRFYWKIGKGISFRSVQYGYGSKFYEVVSNDLKKILPDVKSFSPTNLKYMRYFYESYPCVENRPQAEDDLKAIFKIPWGHNKLILDKCKGDVSKSLFYIKKTLENNWSRSVLMNFLDTNLYERQGKAITNFKASLPENGSDLAKAITKDPYNFDFLTLRENYDEKELKDALMDNIQAFLLEVGRGFAFVGKEYRLDVGNTEQFLDMLFYNIVVDARVFVSR